MSRRAAVLVLGLCSIWLLASAPVAEAHASLRSSDPADGAIVDVAPSSVLLTFTEPPDPRLTVVHVLDSTGNQVETGTPRSVPGRRLQIEEALGELPDGVYTVTWRTVSETDGHVTAGGFSFGVGVSPAGAPSPPGGGAGETPPPSPLSVAGKWSLYVGLSLLLAAGTTGIVAFRGMVPRRRPILIAASALAAGGVVAVIVAERSVVGVSLGDLLSSSAGHRLVWLAAAVAAASLVGIVSAFRSDDRLPAILASSAAALAMLVRAIGGHASGQGVVWWNVGIQWIHVLGVGLWIGGLAWLLLVVNADAARERGAQVRRFSLIAGIGLAAVAATGVLRAVDELGGWGEVLDVLDSSYGIALTVKVGVALVLIALGTVNHYVNVPRYAAGGRSALRRTVGGELVLAAGIFALTGVLTGLPPAGGMHAAMPSKPERLVVTGHDFATTTRVRLEVSPGTVGPNRFVAWITDYDTHEPVTADRVDVTFALAGNPTVGSRLPLEHRPDGSWSAQSTAIAIVGDWDVTVLVQEASGSIQVPLLIHPRVPPPRVDVSRQAGQPDLYTITFSTGVQIQSYVDPGAPGINQFHVTAFDASGHELPLASARVDATGPNGPTRLDMKRFSRGHFIANFELAPGTWAFVLDVASRDGSDLSARFRETFQG
jgi:copper transport protein